MASRTWWRVVAVYAAVVVVMAAVGALAGGDGEQDPLEAVEPPPPRSGIPLDTRSPQVVGGSSVRVLVGLRRPAMGDLPKSQRRDPAAQRAHVRSLAREARALQSALRARGVTFGDPVLYGRVWSGFAATISTRDLRAVQALGLRVEPVRRFYPQADPLPVPRGQVAGDRHPVPVTGGQGGGDGRRGSVTGVRVALLDSGVDVTHPLLRGRVSRVFDAVGRGTVPRGRRDEHGTLVAGVLAAGLPRGARILSIRVAGLQPRPDTGAFEESGTTDQLLSGMERAVDPDGNGDAEDAAPVALVGVSSPYSGFATAPEAAASAAASKLGTLVVAPAGNQGSSAGVFGTVGSPGAAPAVLAVGALDGPVALPLVAVTLASPGGATVVTGELLAGPGRPLRAAIAASGRAARGQVVIARGDASAAVERAARAGAAAVVVASPGIAAQPVPRGSAGRMTVVGLTGDAARSALRIGVAGAGAAELSAAAARPPLRPLAPAPATSRGPAYTFAPKPDLAAPGSARTAAAAGGLATAGGTSIAAARVAAQAALARAVRPGWTPAQVAGALVGTAAPRGGKSVDALLATGAGEARAQLAGDAVVAAEPPSLRLRAGGRARVRIHNLAARAQRVGFAVAGVRLSRPRAVVVPAGRSRTVALRALPGPVGARAATLAGGRLFLVPRGARRMGVPIVVHAPPPAPFVGSLRLTRGRGVRFVAGRVTRRGGRVAVEPVGSLVLRLTGPGERELTPPGGARALLPGEYGYTLTAEVRAGLEPGRYRFEVRARGPAGGPLVRRRSALFSLR